MVERRPIDIPFPRAGLHRGAPRSRQPGLTTLDCLNVWSTDALEQRARGGSRPGLSKAFALQLGSGNPVRLLTTIKSLNSQGTVQFFDTFAGVAMDGANWTAYSGAPYSGFPTVSGGKAQIGAAISAKGAILNTTAISNSGTIIIDLDTENIASVVAGDHTFSVLFGLDDVTPVHTAALEARFSLNSSLNPAVQLFVNGSDVTALTQLTGSFGEFLRVTVNPDNTVSVSLGDLSAPDFTSSPLTWTRAGHRVGFLLQNISGVYTGPLLDSFRVQYSSTTGGFPPVAVIASSNHLLYRQSSTGAMVPITPGTMDLASNRRLSAADRLGKLYIADYEVRASASDGTLDGAGTSFDSATYADWTTLGIDTDGDLIELLSATSGTITDPIVPITTVAAGSLTLANAASGGAVSGIKFRVLRAPKIYDSNTDTLSRWDATVGTTPVGCTICVSYYDTLILAGDPENPRQWYMPRIGNPLDFDYAAVDVRRAVSGSTSDAGQLADPITAVAPFGKDWVVFGAATSLWVLRGHPSLGGRFDNLSRTIGIIDQTAWCVTPEGLLIFLSEDGLYVVNPAGSLQPQAISRDRLPEELQGVDTTLYQVEVGYDVEHSKVHIFVTAKSGGATTHFTFDWTDKGFLPLGFDGDHEPTALCAYQPPGAATLTTLLGGRDGYLRRVDRNVATDDGNNFASHVFLGPFSGDAVDLILHELHAALPQGSGNVSWSILSGKTTEIAATATPRASGTFSAGRNPIVRPRVRGNSLFLKLSSTGGSHWVFPDALNVTIEAVGVTKP